MRQEPDSALTGRRLAQVWAKAHAHDIEALNLLTDHIRTMAQEHASKLVRRCEAEDLVQEVVLSLLGSFENLPCPKNLQGLVFYRSRAKADVMRRRRSYTPRPCEGVTSQTQDPGGLEPWYLVAEREVRAALRVCSEQLPAHLKTCLQRRYNDSESAREIARTLCSSHTAINKHLRTGLAALGKCLQAKGVMA